MILDLAISAHVKWKVQLETAIRQMAQGGQLLDSEQIARDDKCELGQWIHGPGTAYSDNGIYQRLRADHACFHTCAAEVARKINAHDKAGAQSLLYGNFHRQSQATVLAILALKQALKPLP